ncbi:MULTISPECIES: thiol:disulfide interchange protein DsbA/DsbL [unclassified Streptomyces]|uniref:thiol:disulfide interchange protein DsbA/DsbL n=1 Tax=unclassified Streptomyces TaxID=2593676 RepID=UPI003801BBB3
MAEANAGKEYTELSNPVLAPVPGKIEVVHWFWYGCGHSHRFASAVGPWTDKLANDVAYRRLPVMFNDWAEAHAQMFFVLEASGAEDKVHNAVYDAIQNRRLLTDPQDQADFLASQGLDRAKYLAAYRSFGIQSRVQQAKHLANVYQITTTPSMVVNGKYRFDPGMTGGYDRTLKVADQLISKERTA